ncbi:MAG: hypothetical protein IJD17_02485, partial [Clostridia bacterium]|nr:hypothetical protein [Clostridia bacterium]
EEYKLAYAYLISSEAFEELNVAESDIRMNSFSSSRYTVHGATARTTEFGFTIGLRSFEVVCHRVNDEWTVCGDCTEFD